MSIENSVQRNINLFNEIIKQNIFYLFQDSVTTMENYVVTDRGSTGSCSIADNATKDDLGDMTFCMSNYAKESLKMMYMMRSHHMLTDVVLEVEQVNIVFKFCKLIIKRILILYKIYRNFFMLTKLCYHQQVHILRQCSLVDLKNVRCLE